MNGLTLEMHAKEKISVSEGWEVFSWECIPHGEPTQIYRLTGATKTIGPRGGIKWGKDNRTVWIAPSEHAAWLLEWEVRTGLCSECVGKTVVFAGWSVTEGTRTRECGRCHGSGSAPTSAANVPAVGVAELPEVSF